MIHEHPQHEKCRRCRAEEIWESGKEWEGVGSAGE